MTEPFIVRHVGHQEWTVQLLDAYEVRRMPLATMGVRLTQPRAGWPYGSYEVYDMIEGRFSDRWMDLVGHLGEGIFNRFEEAAAFCVRQLREARDG